MFNIFKKTQIEGSKIKISLTGMHCCSCAVNIDLTLEDIKGVLESKTNYARSLTNIKYDPQLISPENLCQEIEKLGYSAKLDS